MNKITLLAPAGNFAALVVAVQNGADAVYLGSKLFNARRLADNFTAEELRRAVQYSHLNNVRAVLALNTLIKNSEIIPFLNQVSLAQQLGVDAIILQDLTFAPLLKKHFPKLEIHASTQAGIMNSASVKYWQKSVDQFILARELTKQEMRAIYEETKACLEVFVHGHLCISYSGQCLISSLIGERSGNRGMCASSCRKQYNGHNYLLSAKDLCLIRNIKDVAESGAAAVKIEGRMKPPEYVAAVTKAYREQIDIYNAGNHPFSSNCSASSSEPPFFPQPVSDEQLNELKMAFNREFTSGYFNNEDKIVDATYSSKRGVYLGTVGAVRNGLLLLEENLEVHDGIGLIEKGTRVGDYVKAIYVDGQKVNKALKGQFVKLTIKGFHNSAKVYLMTKNKGQNFLEVKKRISLQLEMKMTEQTQPSVTVILINDGSKGNLQEKAKEIAQKSKFIISLPTIAAKPKQHPVTAEILTAELKKWKSDIFEIKELEITTDNSFVAKSAITAFRKELEQKLLDFWCPALPEKIVIPPPLSTPTPSQHETEKQNGVKTLDHTHLSGIKKIEANNLHVRVYSLPDVRAALSAGADVIYYDAFALDVAEAIKIAGSRLFLHTPMTLSDKDLEQLRRIIEAVKPAGMMVNNVGVLKMNELFSDKFLANKLKPPMKIILGYQMNIFNDYQLQFYGYPAVASLELNLKELQSFQNKSNLLFYAHGCPVVMTFKEKFAAAALTDEKGYTFRLRKTNSGATEMLYSKTIGILQHTPEVIAAGITNFYLDLEKDVLRLVSLYRKLLNRENVSVKSFKQGVTIGNLVKGVM